AGVDLRRHEHAVRDDVRPGDVAGRVETDSTARAQGDWQKEVSPRLPSLTRIRRRHHNLVIAARRQILARIVGSVVRLGGLALVLFATTARAEPWAVELRGGVELAPLAANDVFERVTAAASYTWRDRWMIGGAVGFAIDPSTSMSLPSGAN